MRNLIGKDTNRDAIIAYLSSPDPDSITDLSEKQKQLLKYYVDAYTMVSNYSTIRDTINVLVKMSALRGEPISTATARRYVNDALEVFGFASEMKAEAVQHLATMTLIDARKMAYEAGDYKEMKAIAAELVKVNPKAAADTPNWDVMEQHTINVRLDKPTEDLFRRVAAKGVVDLDKMMGNMMNSLADDAEEIQE